MEEEAGLEETPPLLNGGKAVYGSDAGQEDLATDGDRAATRLTVEAEEAAREKAGNAVDTSASGLDRKGPTEGAELSAD